MSFFPFISILIWLLAIAVIAVAAYVVIRLGVAHGMRSYKRWERSGDA